MSMAQEPQRYAPMGQVLPLASLVAPDNHSPLHISCEIECRAGTDRDLSRMINNQDLKKKLIKLSDVDGRLHTRI